MPVVERSPSKIASDLARCICPGIGQGARPLWHPHICCGTRSNGEKCRQWVVEGKTRCKFHGGSIPGAYEKTKIRRKMPGFYSKRLGPTLAKRLEELTNVPVHQQMSLYEELAMVRTLASETLAVASLAFEPGNKIPEVLKLQACASAQSAMESVAALVEKISRIEANASDKISVTTLDLFIQQILIVIYEALGDENTDLAKKIEEAVRNTVKVPGSRTNTEKDVKQSILESSIAPTSSAMDAVTMAPNPSAIVDGQNEV